jgi:hypothetical protein
MFSVEPPVFSYQPLTESDAIRLILLHPAPTVSTELECSIEHVTLSQYGQDLINHYTALSYVWGEPMDTKHILLNGSSFHITLNLDSALRHLRDTKSPIRVWADALCIDQSNVTERNQQVQQIGSIYSIAQHTIIYLGDASVNSDSVFSDISSLLAHSAAPLSQAFLVSKCKDAALDIICKGIETQILTRTWFTRVWIFQELLLSRDPWVQCGTKRLKWGDLCRVSFLARDTSRHLRILKDELEDWGDRKISSLERVPDNTIADLPKGAGALGRLEDMHSARHKFQDYIGGNSTGNTLLSILALRRGSGVSDARDMIYAHLGIASDSISGNLGFKVDYSKGCAELFLDIARYFLEKHTDYRILSHVEDVDPLRRRPGLPSWVPDWTSNKVHDLRENSPPRGDRGYRTSAKFSFLLSAEGKYQLACTGTVFGEIHTVGTNLLGFAHLGSAEIRKSWAILLANSVHRPKISDDEERSYEKFFKKRRESFEVIVNEVAKVAGFQGSLSFRTGLNHYEHEWSEGLERMLISIEKEEIKLHPTALASAVPFHFFRHGSNFDFHPSDPGKLQVLEGRRLCVKQITDNIALVPESTQTGDIICGFDGESRMFVLRPITGSKEEGTTQCFALVGMCYCSRVYYSSSAGETIILQ